MAGETAGEVFVETAELLASFPDVFQYHRDASPSTITLVPSLETASSEVRTEAVAKVSEALRA